MTTPNSTAKPLTRYTISMLDMTTYRKSFEAMSQEEALAMADAEQEKNGAENWSVVADATEFEIIAEEPVHG